jgi:hypothetical protein
MPVGALLQLAAYGAQDVYLTGNPQITFFVSVYKRHTNFAVECVEQYFEGTVDFGRRISISLQRCGDLVHNMYLRIELPQLANSGTTTYSWANFIGHALIDYVEVEIGGQVIDKQYGQWLQIWSELTVTNSKRLGYFDMVEVNQNFSSVTQPGPLLLLIPLTFWFNKYLGCALPLIALQYHEVRINFALNPSDDLIVSSDTNDPYSCGGCDPPSIKDAKLLVDYIYLDSNERRIFAKSNHEYLIEQLQLDFQTLPSNIEEIPITMTFNHPVKELIWVLQTPLVLADKAEYGIEWFNFSDRSEAAAGTPTDLLYEAKIQFEGQDRFLKRRAKYFRDVQPFQYHTTIPQNFIYNYSFALNPEKHQPSGTCNFSRIDNAILRLYLPTGGNAQSLNLSIYATNYNIFKIKSGMGGVEYTD